MITRRRLLPPALSALGVAALFFPAVAQAHGIVGKADLPIPVWLFSWAAAIVLVVSFVALSTLWTHAAAAERAPRGACSGCPSVLARLASLLGVGAVRARALQRLRRNAGLRSANFSVTFIYVIFWVGLPVASVLFGDVFAALSPWRSMRARDPVGRAPALVARSSVARAGRYPREARASGRRWPA